MRRWRLPRSRPLALSHRQLRRQSRLQGRKSRCDSLSSLYLPHQRRSVKERPRYKPMLTPRRAHVSSSVADSPSIDPKASMTTPPAPAMLKMMPTPIVSGNGSSTRGSSETSGELAISATLGRSSAPMAREVTRLLRNFVAETGRAMGREGLEPSTDGPSVRRPKSRHPTLSSSRERSSSTATNLAAPHRSNSPSPALAGRPPGIPRLRLREPESPPPTCQYPDRDSPRERSSC